MGSKPRERPSYFWPGRRPARNDGVVRIGYTASRKVGNAVLRNRAKRRLRAAVAIVLPNVARPGWDYVLIARRDATVLCHFATLLEDLSKALFHLHRKQAQ